MLLVISLRFPLRSSRQLSRWSLPCQALLLFWSDLPLTLLVARPVLQTPAENQPMLYGLDVIADLCVFCSSRSIMALCKLERLERQDIMVTTQTARPSVEYPHDAS